MLQALRTRQPAGRGLGVLSIRGSTIRRQSRILGRRGWARLRLRRLLTASSASQDSSILPGWECALPYFLATAPGSFFPSLTIPILDSKRRVIALLGGQPRDSLWKNVANDAEKAMRDVEPRIRLSRGRLKHRRARTRFAALSRGISHGG